MKPLLHYILLQGPGSLMVAALLWWAVHAGVLQPGIALIGFVIWLLKDLLLYPAFKHATAPAPATGALALVGREGVLVREAAPRGQLRLGGELWAVRGKGEQPIAAGTRVRVVDAQGLVLIVEPVTAQPPR